MKNDYDKTKVYFSIYFWSLEGLEIKGIGPIQICY